jgi:hypothetical protein
MVTLVDLKWLIRCEQQLRDMADDPDHAALIRAALDADPELREALAHLYVQALRTLERISALKK